MNMKMKMMMMMMMLCQNQQMSPKIHNHFLFYTCLMFIVKATDFWPDFKTSKGSSWVFSHKTTPHPLHPVSQKQILPEANKSPLKMHGWKMDFLLGFGRFFFWGGFAVRFRESNGTSFLNKHPPNTPSVLWSKLPWFPYTTRWSSTQQ